MSPQQPAPANVNNEEAVQNAPLPLSIRVFPLLLIMVAVFPIALGIGVTLQTTPSTATKIDAAEHVASRMPNHIQPNPSPAAIALDRSKGDELLRSGRYEVALHLYRSLGTADSLRAPPELALRMGMCEEGLGRWDDALLTYRAVASSHHRPMACAAMLGQSRIWMRLSEFSKAEPLLRALLLSSDDDLSLSADQLADIAIPYSIVVSEQALAPTAMPTIAGLAPVTNPIDWSLSDALQWADSLASANHTEKDGATDGVANPSRSVSEDDGNVDQSPENRLARPLFHAVARQPLSQTLQSALGGRGIRLEWSDLVKDRAQTHEVGFSGRGIPLNLLVTAACSEIGARWDLRSADRTIVISESGSDPQSIDACRGVLTSVIDTFPESRLVGSAKFGLAQLAATNQQFEESARLFASLAKFSSSPLAVRGAFNAAVLYRLQNDLNRTCQSLDVVVHGAPGNELHTRALILYGQTLIDRGQFREAAFQLKRAANSRHVPDDQARATVFLAIAQLLDQKPQEAAESLFLHRFQFQQPSVRNAAALMTSIARWRTADNAAKQREAAFLYRSIIAVDEDSEWLGPAGQLLLGQAMRDADMEDRMAELFLDVMQCHPPRVIETQMELAMADYWYGRQRVSEAKEIWSRVYAAGGADSIAAGLRMSDIALKERHPEICIEICRTLQHQDAAPRVDLLKLSGRAHEMAGRPVLAAQCFAGQWPLP